jgi:hypothetical protein
MSEQALFESARKRKIVLLREELAKFPLALALTMNECDRVMFLVKEIERLEYAILLGNML